jgi:hypothetical protein
MPAILYGQEQEIFLNIVKTDTGARPDSYAKFTGASFFRDKAAGA